MKNRVLITGASRGIGEAIAVFLEEMGFSVVGTSRNPKIKTGDEKKVSFPLIAMDVTESGSVKGGINEALDILGGGIDILINNAGISHLGPFEEMPDEQGRKIIETNFFGIANVIREVLPIMRGAGGGLVINISSLAGMVGIPFQSFYAASKYALEGWTESIRMELSPQKISVVLVEPGDIKTNIADHHLVCETNSPHYSDPFRNTCRVIRGNVDSAGSPEDVAKVVYRVIKRHKRGKKPKIRYPAGKGAAINAFLLKFVPDVFKEIILTRYYDLHKKP